MIKLFYLWLILITVFLVFYLPIFYFTKPSFMTTREKDKVKIQYGKWIGYSLLIAVATGSVVFLMMMDRGGGDFIPPPVF